jgi:hypothetical protein
MFLSTATGDPSIPDLILGPRVCPMSARRLFRWIVLACLVAIGCKAEPPRADPSPSVKPTDPWAKLKIPPGGEKVFVPHDRKDCRAEVGDVVLIYSYSYSVRPPQFPHISGINVWIDDEPVRDPEKFSPEADYVPGGPVPIYYVYRPRTPGEHRIKIVPTSTFLTDGVWQKSNCLHDLYTITVSERPTAPRTPATP